VLDDVVQRLLHHPQEHRLAGEREARLVGQVALGRQVVSQLQAVQLPVEGADEADVGQGLGTQLEDQGAHLGQGRLGELDHRVERLARLARVALGAALRGVGGQHDRVDRLAHGVVQFAGEMAPRLVGRLVACPLVQADVLDRHRRLGGDTGGPAQTLLVPGDARGRSGAEQAHHVVAHPQR
jgi:hypothetical protein